MYYILDRIEGGIAVCEDENGIMVQLPAAELPPNVAEGQRMLMENERLVIAPDTEREERIKRKMDALFGKKR